MPRIFLPALVALGGTLGAATLLLTTYTQPIEGAASDPELYNLIAHALHDPELDRKPHVGQSPLPLSTAESSRAAASAEPVVAGEDRSQPLAWAGAAAKTNSAALRDWLGRWVLATSTTKADTLRMTLHRVSLRTGCPWFSSLVATTVGIVRRDFRLVRISASCPPLPQDSVAVEVAEAIPDRYHRPPTDTLDQATYDGWKQFRLLCDRCHGEDARGTTFGPDLLPAFRPAGSVSTQAAFVDLMTNGRPQQGMPSGVVLGLSPDHFDGLYRYLLGRTAGRYQGGRPVLRKN